MTRTLVRRTMTAALLSGLVVLTVAVPQQAFASEGASQGANSTSSRLEIKGSTVTTPGTTLKDGSFKLTGSDSDKASVPPAAYVNPGTTDAWRITGAWPGVELLYQIYENDAPTDFWVKGNFNQPLIGGNRASCEIYKGHPSYGGTKTLEAPYFCGWSDIYGYNPSPVFHVNAATVITSPAEATDLITRLCSTRSSDVGCSFANTTVTPSWGNRVPASDVLSNPNDFTVGKTLTWTNTTAETTNLSFTAEVNITFIKDVISTKFAATYGQTWTSSVTRKDSASMDVPARSAGWFEYSPALRTMKGDWIINNGTWAWRLSNITFTSPDPSGQGILSACSAPLPDWQSHSTCANPTTVAMVPQS